MSSQSDAVSTTSWSHLVATVPTYMSALTKSWTLSAKQTGPSLMESVFNAGNKPKAERLCNESASGGESGSDPSSSTPSPPSPPPPSSPSPLPPQLPPNDPKDPERERRRKQAEELKRNFERDFQRIFPGFSVNKVLPSPNGSNDPNDPKNMVVSVKIPNTNEEMLLAGAVGGFWACFLLHPLDLLKTRFQAAAARPDVLGRRPSYFATLANIIQKEGFRALWRGVGPALFGSTIAWGAFAYLRKLGQPTQPIQPKITTTLETAVLDSKDSKSSVSAPVLKVQGKEAASRQLSASAVGQSLAASLITTSVTTPIWLIKTRMCLQGSQTMDQARSTVVQSFLDRERSYAASWLAKMEPYRTELTNAGVTSGTTTGSNAAAATRFGSSNYPVHRVLERVMYPYYSHLPGPDKAMHPALLRAPGVERIAPGDISALLRMGRTYPLYQATYSPVVSNYHVYNGLFDGLRTIYTQEGFRGLFRGLIPGLGGALQGGLQFSLYEALRDYELAGTTKTELSLAGSGTAISAARFLSTLTIYPCYVIRTQMQDNRVGSTNAPSALSALQSVVQRSGLRGLYAGYLMHVLKGLPSSLITAVIYEKVLAQFRLVRAINMGLFPVPGPGSSSKESSKGPRDRPKD